MDKWVYVEPKKWDSPLHVCISKWKLEAESNRIFYNVNVTVNRNGEVNDRKWEVWKPYKEFLELKRSLGVKLNMKFKSSFPKKYYLRQKMTPNEIEIRRHQLETWLCELCHSEQFVFVSHRIVLSKLNIFFNSNVHGGAILIKHTSGCLNDIALRPSLFNNPFSSNSTNTKAVSQGNLAAIAPEESSENVLEQSTHQIRKQAQYTDIITQIHHQPNESTGVTEYPDKKRYFFHRLLMPLLESFNEHADKPLFPITMDYLITQLPCKVDLQSVLMTVSGGFQPESGGNPQQHKSPSGGCEGLVDESDEQLEKDYQRDRIVVQDIRISGNHLNLKQLVSLITVLSNEPSDAFLLSESKKVMVFFVKLLK